MKRLCENCWRRRLLQENQATRLWFSHSNCNLYANGCWLFGLDLSVKLKYCSCAYGRGYSDILWRGETHVGMRMQLIFFKTGGCQLCQMQSRSSNHESPWSRAEAELGGMCLSNFRAVIAQNPRRLSSRIIFHSSFSLLCNHFVMKRHEEKNRNPNYRIFAKKKI